jgi:hypothetical protein
MPSGFIEKGDTTLTIYSGLYKNFFKLYINGASNTFPTALNPNQRELWLMVKYGFYCDSRERVRKISPFLDLNLNT